MNDEEPVSLVATRPRIKVLLVDDDIGVLRGYRRALEAEGQDVEVATSGEEAIEVFRASRPGVVVSDISMPGMSGLDLMRRIREIDLDAPVILITGLPSLDTAVEAMDQGAMRYLVKPVDAVDLIATISQASDFHRLAILKRRAIDQLGDLEKQIGDRAGLEVKFRRALDALFMVYQPIVRWSTREVIGYEALVRSREATIPHPGALFDAADRLDRVDELSRRIRELAPLPMIPAPERGRLFYNLHVASLVDESLYDPDSALASIADRVVLEVTERAALDEIRDARTRVKRLRDLGYQIAVDDLGAGYAGLNSFAQLEPDIVKLDMALIRDIDTSSTKQKLTRSIARVCSEMGLDVVAEGIETREERDCVVALGCDLLQGYLFARPGEPFPDTTF
jgi:EAL domain-containing protein (putative c-di-GMP-specific phosphodiesterase class I)/CheY-like chemotaxis protein